MTQAEREEHNMELVIRLNLDRATPERVARTLAYIADHLPEPMSLTRDGPLMDAASAYCGTAEIIDDREALILSAAPDLLAACKAARSVAAHMGWNLGPAGKAIEDALTKAEGGGR